MTTSIMVAFTMACGPHQGCRANIEHTGLLATSRGVIYLLFEAMLVVPLAASPGSKPFEKTTEVETGKKIELL